MAGAVTCPIDTTGPNYPGGITYTTGVDTLNADDGVIINGTGGITVSGSAGNAVVNAPNVTITSVANGIELSDSADRSASITAGGDITAAGAFGLHAFTDGTGAANVTYGPGTLTMSADGAIGVLAESASGTASVTTTGAIVTTGADAHGMVVTGAGDVTVDAGDITVTGQGASGAVAASTGGAVNFTNSGNIHGGWVTAPLTVPTTAPAVPLSPGQTFATGILAIAPGSEETPGAVTVTNNGELGSLSDSALVAYSPSITVDNAGTMTGFVNLIGDTVTFNNSSGQSFDIRNFADTDGDGVRDTEGVSISDFGGAGVFNNGATGAVVLRNVTGATLFGDTTGIIAPEGSDPTFHDIQLEGVERGELTGLTEFHNAGAIVMQDALAGGTTAVAGDVLRITGRPAGPDTPATPATFFSDGGSLSLDTVLNEGGAAASQSDVLMLDAAEVGVGGPTQVHIANAGGLGAQTIENGILVVDVADPTLSASGVFAMNDIVIAGPWQYQLFQGGDAANGGDPADGNWYLRSNIAPTTDVYRAIPGSLTRFTRAAVGTLQQRLGNRWWRVPERTVEHTVTVPPPPPAPPQTREFVVYFDWDRSEIRPDAQTTINEAAEYAKTGNAARIVVIGHTDTSGPEDYNMALSERRAQPVSAALQAQGVAAQVIGMEWFGETQPAVDTGDGVREQRNRRAYIQVSVPGMATGPVEPSTRVETQTIPASVEIQGAGVWGRIVGSTAQYKRDDDRAETDEDTWMAQAGVDFVVHQEETSRLIAGFSVHYGEVNADVSNTTLGDLSSVDSNGTGVSASLTYYNDDGVYVDGVLSGTWFDIDIGSGLLGELGNSEDGSAWAVSLEGGKRIPFNANSNYYWIPQGQLIYTSPDMKNFTDRFGANVSDADADSLIGRLGVALEYQNRTAGDDGAVSRMQGYGIFNLLYEFLDPGGANVSGIEFDEDSEAFWGEFGGGFTYSFNEQWSLYGDVSYRTAWENFGDSYNAQGSLGLRYNW